MRLTALCLLICTATLFAPQNAVCVEPLERVHAVQIGAFQNRPEAEALQTKAELEGWTPVKVVELTTGVLPFRVRVGEFDVAADASWYKLALRRRGYRDAYELSTKAETITTTVVGGSGPIEPCFRRWSLGAMSGATPFSQLKRRAIDAYIADDTESATLSTSSSVAVADILTSVANCQLAATKLEVCRARLRIANISHYANRKWLTAYHAYGEALAIARPGSWEQAESLLQRAAVLLELGQAEMGNMNEVRRACDLVGETVPTSFTRILSTAALMHAEATFNEDRYEDALQEFLLIAKKWPDRQREIVGAQLYAGVCCAKLNRFAEAKPLLQQITRWNADTSKFYAWQGRIIDPSFDAATWLIAIARSEGNSQEEAKWAELRNQIKARHGNSLLSKGENYQ